MRRYPWARALAIVVLLFATPGATEAVQELASWVSGDCCDEPCEEGDDDACGSAGLCSRCDCCVHPSVAPNGVAIVPSVSTPIVWTVQWSLDDEAAPGFRTGLFRPPTA